MLRGKRRTPLQKSKWISTQKWVFYRYWVIQVNLPLCLPPILLRFFRYGYEKDFNHHMDLINNYIYQCLDDRLENPSDRKTIVDLFAEKLKKSGEVSTRELMRNLVSTCSDLCHGTCKAIRCCLSIATEICSARHQHIDIGSPSHQHLNHLHNSYTVKFHINLFSFDR